MSPQPVAAEDAERDETPEWIREFLAGHHQCDHRAGFAGQEQRSRSSAIFLSSIILVKIVHPLYPHRYILGL